MHRLWLFRHAKSDWSTDAADFDRPLKGRGRHDAPRMGRWLELHGIRPDAIWCSPAMRARESLELALQHWSLDPGRIRHDSRLYEARGSTLLELIQAAEEAVGALMLVGHNPGLDDLLETLCEGPMPRTAKGKLLTTANLAEIEFRGTWKDLEWDSGELVRIVRPEDLDDS